MDKQIRLIGAFIAVILWNIIPSFPQSVTYVKADAHGLNDGSSWQNAYSDLSQALAKTAGGQIWVAKGVYLPSLDSGYRKPADRRDETFCIRTAVQLYGGFSGTEHAIIQRDIRKNTTVLSGDFNQDDIEDYRIHQLWLHPTRQDNACRVVNIVNAGTVTMDGFVVTGGNVNSTRSPDKRSNLELFQGGGIYVYAAGQGIFSNVTIRNCRLISNAAAQGAGGVRNFGRFGANSYLSLINCQFFNCQAAFAGGLGTSAQKAAVETIISNCTFTNNYALYCGGSISTVIEPKMKPGTNRSIIRNTIFWGNDANGCRPDVDDYNAETIVSYCDLESMYGGIGNFKMKPYFINPAGPDGHAGTTDDDFSILAFCPNEKRDSCIPPVLMTAFLIHGKPVQFGATSNQSAVIALQPEENTFGIAIALLGFSLSPENALEYRLDGLDQDWHTARQTDTASYKDLHGGTFQFRIRAAGTSAEKTLLIKITPYFWQTGWFRFLAFTILVIALILANVLYKNRRLRTKKIALEHARDLENFQRKAAESEMRALRAQMNPHFIFNSLNSINAYILRQGGYDASRYLTNFSHLMRQILDNSVHDSVSIERETEFLESYLKVEAVRFENNLNWDIQVDDQIDPFDTEIPSMVLQPFVENAIWHGLSNKPGGGWVHIRISKTSHVLSLVIEDNGIGRDQASQLRQTKTSAHESKGLKITAERLALYDEKYKMQSSLIITDLFDESGHAAGTRVEIKICPKESNSPQT